MTVQEMITILSNSGGFWVAVVLILLTLIEITPIKVNPWSFISKRIGKLVNKDIIDKIDRLDINMKDLRTDVEALREECDEREATLSRARILRFGDEIRHENIRHSKEHYDNVLADITSYENYCNTHPNYVNNIAIMTIKYIKDMYQIHLKNDDFL